MVESLWPVFQKIKINTPISILREQASELGKSTNNLVEARVNQVDSSTVMIKYNFEFIAPALGGYRYRIFSIEHDIRTYRVVFECDEEIYMELQ